MTPPRVRRYSSTRERGLALAYAVASREGDDDDDENDDDAQRLTIVLTGGGVSGVDRTWATATRVADAARGRWRRGCAVLVWDRRNTGASGFSLGASGEPLPVQDADDLHDLITGLGLAPCVLVGQSSGARVSAIVASRHPSAVRGLVLAPPTGGAAAAEALCRMYYEEPKRWMLAGDARAVAAAWGMRDLAAVAALEACDRARFAAAMDASSAWMRSFAREAMLGLTDGALAALVPRRRGPEPEGGDAESGARALIAGEERDDDGGAARVAVAHSGDLTDTLHEAATAVRVATVVRAKQLHLVPGVFTPRAGERLAELAALVGGAQRVARL